MSLQPTLSNPAVVVNDQPVKIIPNSASYKPGRGDKKVRAQSAGGNSISVVVTDDAETKLSMFKMGLYVTKENLALVDGWQNSPDGNTIDVSEGTLNLPFRSMVVTTDPDRVLGADGTIEIEFQGQPLQ